MITTPHLLIADDDRAFRETLQDVFSAQGFQTTLAANGEQALQLATQSNFHLALMDLQMPKLSGFEAVRQLKQHDRRLPCILISAAVDDRVREQANELAFHTVLTKPISVRAIRGSVQHALTEHYGWK